jgi:hypothetical protein
LSLESLLFVAWIGNALMSRKPNINRGHQVRLALAIILSVSLTACASGRAHENFKNIMSGQVDRKIDDPDIERNRYSNLRVGTKKLLNGNIEEEFRSGRGLRCRVFFEIDNKAAKIIGWRYEGSDEDCAIVP